MKYPKLSYSTAERAMSAAQEYDYHEKDLWPEGGCSFQALDLDGSVLLDTHESGNSAAFAHPLKEKNDE
jgi:hypothetical protein